MQRKRRPNIGLLGSPMHSEQNFWAGVADAAEKYEVNLFVFLGGAVMTKALKPTVRYGLIGIESAAVLYDLIDVERMDGLITWAGSGAGLGIHLNEHEMNAFFQRYHPLPIVNYEKVVDGIPSILTDTAEGMRELLIHMIEMHGSRRIALLRGPETHFESNERHRAYNETLAAYGLPVDQNLVCTATGWDMNQGIDMMRSLINDRQLVAGIDFDTVLGTESQYVASALHELQARGIHVPDDVRIAGYNDTPDAIAVTPPITIMFKSFYEAGHKSLETLVQLLEGKPVPDQITIPSELVIRRSCGCMPPIVQQVATSQLQFMRHEKPPESIDSILTEHQDAIITNLTQSISALTSSQLATEMATALTHALIADLRNKATSANAFITALESAIHTIPVKNMAHWQSILSSLRQDIAQYLTNDRDLWFQVETLWQQARVVIQLEVQRLEQQTHLENLLLVLNLRETDRRLMNVFDMEGLLDTIAQELPRLGIPACYISLYEKPQPYRYPQIVPDWSKLMLAFDERGRIELPSDGLRFPSRQLIPDDIPMLDRAQSWVIVPIYAGQQQFGFALLEIGPQKGTLYTELWQLISNALQLVLLMQERLELGLERERVAILSNFIRDAGHEFKTPLSTINTNLYLLRTTAGMDNPNRYLETLKSQSRHIETLVDSMLTMSQLDSSDKLAFASLHVDDLIRSLETQMRPLADQKKITLSVDIAHDLPPIQGDQDALFLALTHIADNAIRYTPVGGSNSIRAYSQYDSIHIEFEDTGIGIDDDDLPKVFERFYRVDQARTDRGAGLGLSIAKRIVEIHCGSIEVTSTLDQGSIFKIILPR